MWKGQSIGFTCYAFYYAYKAPQTTKSSGRKEVCCLLTAFGASMNNVSTIIPAWLQRSVLNKKKKKHTHNKKPRNKKNQPKPKLWPEQRTCLRDEATVHAWDSVRHYTASLMHTVFPCGNGLPLLPFITTQTLDLKSISICEKKLATRLQNLYF